MSESTFADIGRQIYLAERRSAPLPPIRDLVPGLDPAGAYAIQQAYAGLRLADAARLRGRKIGCTSRAIQELFGIDTPDYGQIFSDMIVADGGQVATDELIAPMVEPEIAFLLASDLQGPGVGRSDVLAATQAIMPCLEIIDSRVQDWKIEFVDTVADNGSSARCVFGMTNQRVDSQDLREITVTMHQNGQQVSEGDGQAVLGHPADSVAWLANALAPYGQKLGAGEYVLSGSMTTAVRATRGDHFEALFSIGHVSCEFV